MNITIERLNSFKLWWIFFFYTFFVSAFVQIVLLPYIFPGLHAGHGLLNSSFDSICFHESAVDLANRIRIHGWSVWQLRPGGQSPAGIASIFYFFTISDPRILIPFSAALHASSALVLVNLLNLFVKNKTKAIFCVLPFLVFPSNLQWTAQWHRDGFSILGVILILQSIVSLSRVENYKAENWFFINFRSMFLFVCGIILIWIARPYQLTIIDLFVKLFFSILFFLFLFRIFKKEISWEKTLFIFLSMLLIIFALERVKINTGLVDFNESVSVSDDKEERIEVKHKIEEVSQPAVGSQPIAGEPTAKKEAQIAVAKEEVHQDISRFETKEIKVEVKKLIKNDPIENHWKRSFWLPLFIENKAYGLAQARRGFRFSSPEAKSNIDQDVGFGSVKDILIYLPRAAQIAFLAPFPNQWLREGSYQGNSLMRRIASIEMIVIYFALLFLPYVLYHWRKRIEIWIISIFCIYIMLAYGSVVCNIGTLYRMRYAYITILVALGIAGFIVSLEDLKIKRKIK